MNEPVTKEREQLAAIKLALEALEHIDNNYMSLPKSGNEALKALQSIIKQQPTLVQEWMKPHPKCDEACLFQCTKGFTQFPECAITSLVSPVQEPLHDEKVRLIAHNECPEDWDSLDNKECWLKGFVIGFKTAEWEYKA
jgi:hypothetical protein